MRWMVVDRIGTLVGSTGIMSNRLVVSEPLPDRRRLLHERCLVSVLDVICTEVKLTNKTSFNRTGKYTYIS